MGWDLILKNWLRTGRRGTINQPVRHFLTHGMWTGRRPLPTGRGHSVIPCCEGQLFKVTRVHRFFGSQEAKGTRILDVKHDVCIVWIVLENFDFTHIRLIRLWILHDFTMSCQVHQRLWIPGKVPPRWGFTGLHEMLGDASWKKHVMTTDGAK